MQRPPGWFQRVRSNSREVLAAVRPHDHTAMFAPTYPVRIRTRFDGRRVIVLEPEVTVR